MKRIVLFSGGLDSSALALYVKKNSNVGDTFLLFYGRTTKRVGEYASAKRFVEKYKLNGFFYDYYISDFNDVSPKDDEYIPLRNTKLVLHALSKMVLDDEETRIYIGLVDTPTHFADCTQEWLDAINQLIKLEYPNVTVLAPFIDRDKEYVFKLGCSCGLNINDTYSCNFPNPYGEECGKCGDCKFKAKHQRPMYLRRD